MRPHALATSVKSKANTRTHAYTHTYTHKKTHKNTHTHIHTHTHTHTRTGDHGADREGTSFYFTSFLRQTRRFQDKRYSKLKLCEFGYLSAGEQRDRENEKSRRS